MSTLNIDLKKILSVLLLYSLSAVQGINRKYLDSSRLKLTSMTPTNETTTTRSLYV